MRAFAAPRPEDPPCLAIDWLEVCEAGYLKGLIASAFCAPRDEVIDCPEPGLVAGQVVALLVVYAARRRRTTGGERATGRGCSQTTPCGISAETPDRQVI